MKPNLFQFATSELSQDAIIAWLLSWADGKCSTIDANLHACAVDFARALLGEKEGYDIKTVEAGRQWNNIDIWAKVNDEYFIVIEDKKGTREHSDQLRRYAEIAKEYYKNKKIKNRFVYFKMEPQGDYSNIKDAGFSLFSRKEMLPILEQYEKNTPDKEKNDILSDYCDHVKWLDWEINRFRTFPLGEWDWYPWQGFFEAIQEGIDGNWSYIPNPAGGFLGFWWHHHYINWNGREFDIFLQLEQEKMIFKLNPYEPEYRSEIRDYFREILWPVAENHGVDIRRHGRVGNYMGVARLNGDYRIEKDGAIDVPATIENLRKMERVLEAVEREMKK